MITIGITGGYATGKTAVVKMFEKLGGKVLYADKIAHKVMRPHTPVWKEVVRYFGKGILKKGNSIDRHKLAKIVFLDKRKLKKLNKIVHPFVREELKRIITARDVKRLGACSEDESASNSFRNKILRSLAAEYFIQDRVTRGGSEILAIEIPLLFEAGLESWFTKTIIVTCNKKAQYERAMKRDKISKKELLLRIKSQWSLNKKREKADFVVDNSGSMEETRKQVYGICEKLWNES